jgi:hypothetical protein
MFPNNDSNYTEEKNLARHVSTRNQVNVMANELRIHFQKVLLSYVDKKVVKVTPYKSWIKGIDQEMQKLQDWMKDQGFRLYFTFSYSCIFATLDKAYNISEHSVNYVKKEFTVALIKDHVILEDCSRFIDDKFRVDYTVEEVVETRKKISDLNKQVHELESIIREFQR